MQAVEEPTYIAKPVEGELITKNRRNEVLEPRNLNYFEMIRKVNIAETLDENELNRIGELVWNEYDIDRKSRVDWERQVKEARDLF